MDLYDLGRILACSLGAIIGCSPLLVFVSSHSPSLETLSCWPLPPSMTLEEPDALISPQSWTRCVGTASPTIVACFIFGSWYQEWMFWLCLTIGYQHTTWSSSSIVMQRSTWFVNHAHVEHVVHSTDHSIIQAFASVASTSYYWCIVACDFALPSTSIPYPKISWYISWWSTIVSVVYCCICCIPLQVLGYCFKFQAYLMSRFNELLLTPHCLVLSYRPI